MAGRGGGKSAGDAASVGSYLPPRHPPVARRRTPRRLRAAHAMQQGRWLHEAELAPAAWPHREVSVAARPAGAATPTPAGAPWRVSPALRAAPAAAGPATRATAVAATAVAAAAVRDARDGGRGADAALAPAGHAARRSALHSSQAWRRRGGAAARSGCAAHPIPSSGPGALHKALHVYDGLQPEPPPCCDSR